MFTLRLLLMTFAVFDISSVVCPKKVCDFEDSKCLTATLGLTFMEFINGMPGVESSEPLHQDLIEGNLSIIKYKIIDGYLTGMRNCKVELVKVSLKDLKYDFHVGCPHLTLESRYELMNEISSKFMKQEGTCKVDFYDYHFLFHGDFMTREGESGNIYIRMKTHVLEVKAKGKVHYEFTNLFNGDKEKSDAMHRLINENWETVDELTRQPVMEAFMDKFIENLNAYKSIVPVQDLFAY